MGWGRSERRETVEQAPQSLGQRGSSCGVRLSTRVQCPVNRSGPFCPHLIQDQHVGCLWGVTRSEWLSAGDLKHWWLEAVC